MPDFIIEHSDLGIGVVLLKIYYHFNLSAQYIITIHSILNAIPILFQRQGVRSVLTKSPTHKQNLGLVERLSKYVLFGLDLTITIYQEILDIQFTQFMFFFWLPECHVVVTNFQRIIYLYRLFMKSQA